MKTPNARGRPKLGEMVKVTLSLDPETIAILERIGQGNKSAAVRALASAYKTTVGVKKDDAIA